VLRRIFGSKRDEIIGHWRKLHNEELHNSYPSPNIIRKIKSGRVRREHVQYAWGEKCVGISGRKTRRKEITRKTYTYMGG
jgi:hypothetical protein